VTLERKAKNELASGYDFVSVEEVSHTLSCGSSEAGHLIKVRNRRPQPGQVTTKPRLEE
jgi:hypothetical protein